MDQPRVARSLYRILFPGIFLTGFATLLFELSLIRILSFTIWYHFAYVVISTALLGFGAAGSFLALRPQFAARDPRSALARCAFLSGLAALGCLFFVSRLALDPMRILEEPFQAILFVTYQVVAAVPFFFAGLVVSAALRAGAERVDRLYFWDLFGAGLGCALTLPLMNLATPPGAVVVSAATFAGASAVFASRRGGRVAGIAAAGLLLVAAGFADAISFTPARSKEYSLQRNQLGFEPHFSRWTGLFRTDVLRRPDAAPRPRFLPGLSSKAPPDAEWPAYYVHHDATAGTGIFELGDDHGLRHLDYDILRFPYLVANPSPRVLVIGVGGGRDVIAAVQYGAPRVTGVELDPVTVDLIRNRMANVTHGFFRRPEVRLVAGEGRHFVRTTQDQYDLIQLTGVDTLSAMNSGAYVLAENYLYTVEAFHDYLDHLAPGGILSFSTGNLNPARPRAAGRMVSVAQRALRERGIDRPQDHIAVVDSRALYVEIMIRTEPYEPAQINLLAEHAARLGFAPLYLPGRGGHPVFDGLISATGKKREELLAGLPFLQTATTDRQPFFMTFFRWGDLFEPGNITPSHVTALGQIVLALLLISLTALGALLILGPLVSFGRRGGVGRRPERIGSMVYFLGVGLGFMLFEISLIQQFVLFLGYPTYSLSVTLASLLLSLGLGSYVSRRWMGHERVVLPAAVGLIALFTLLYAYGLPLVQGPLLGTPLAVRSLATVLLIAPLGLVMGTFFPLGIRRVADLHVDLVPWAWGINGCASVTGGVLAVALAITYGFTMVWFLSVLLYALGTVALLSTYRRPGTVG